MTDLTLTQAYLLCTLSDKGGYSSLDMEKQTCLPAAGLLELWLDGAVTLEDKRIAVRGLLPEGADHLRSLYQAIQERQPLKLEKLVELYSYDVRDRSFRQLMEDVGETLVRAGGAEKRSGGLLGKKTLFVPDSRRRDAVVQMIRAELLEDGVLTDDVAALAVLLEKSGALKQYFSVYERGQLKRRLKELKNSPENEAATQMMEYLTYLMSLITVGLLAT